ncbi:MAG: ATP-binding protein [Colwellia sp.]|nr:ATP-binding protein [Colwellia sp.]
MLLLLCLLLFWLYYRKSLRRKAEQDKIERALKIAEAEKLAAEKSAQAKISFLARMSHEIRTPMNGVFGMAEALSFTNLDDNQQELLTTLKGSASNLLALLNDVLDFSKMDAGKLTLELVPVNFHQISQNIINSFSHPEKDKSLNFNLRIDKNITHSYFTDPTRLTQVFNNLVSNAVKFTQQGNITLAIVLMERKLVENITYDTLRFSVADTGIGIAKNNQALLFTPFIQADSEITRKYGGTGLGLSICQEIVHAMGGTINLESTEHIGSTFHFTLTFKQSGLEKERIERRNNTRSANCVTDERFKLLRVLVAEDNLVNIMVLNAQLERLNIKADVVNDGAQALVMHNKMPYDIIISDCHMPILDGFELAKKLSSKKTNKPLWLIAITADALSGSAEKCLAAGFDDYIAKPCPQETITNKLNRAYRQLQLQKGVNLSSSSANNYLLFDLQALLKVNNSDLILASKVAQIFADTWQKDRLTLQIALEVKNFETLYALTHKIRGSVRYLCYSPLDSMAQQVENHALVNNEIEVDNFAQPFISQLEQLADEIDHWLASLPKSAGYNP